MSLEILIKRDDSMRFDAFEIISGNLKSSTPRIDFMNKYGLSKTNTIQYLTVIRRQYKLVLTKIC